MDDIETQIRNLVHPMCSASQTRSARILYCRLMCIARSKFYSVILGRNLVEFHLSPFRPGRLLYVG